VPTFPDFIRRTPPAALRIYFTAIGAELPQRIPWDGRANDVVAPLLRAIDDMADADRLRIVNDAERVSAMADEPGQAAIYAVSGDHARLDAMENGHARALWVFLNEPIVFQHAEEVRFADDKRFTRLWDGFLSQRALTVARDASAISRFRQSVADRFGSANVEVEICDRSRPMLDGPDAALVQASVYREGRAGDVLEFVNGRLSRRPHRPVVEAALTYEPATGVIEVVAAARETRETLVRLFAEHLLGTAFQGERLPIRQFRLDRLRQAFDFPTDPADGIESVRITMMKLMPFETQRERITLECMRGTESTIWQLAADRLKDQEQGIEGYAITAVRLTVRFRAVPGTRGGRTLPVTITMPKGCDLKDRTERERIIGEKYLRRWGLLRDV
jgi:hypothetical protein